MPVVTPEAPGALDAHPDLASWNASMDRRYGQVFSEEAVQEPGPPDDSRLRNSNTIGWVASSSEVQTGIEPSTSIEIPGPSFRLANRHPAVEQAVGRRVAQLQAGRIAVRSETGGGKETFRTKTVSMLTMVREAMQGSEQHRQGALANVKKFLNETTVKFGDESRATAHFDKQGKLWQFGQSSDDFLANTFQTEGVNPLSIAEARDLARFEEHVKRDLVKPGEHYHTLSLVSEGDRKTLKKRGYFLESMTMIDRDLMLHEDRQTVTISSRFIAGVDMDRLATELGDGMSEQEITAREDRALEIRDDKAIVQEYYRRRGVKIPASAAGTLELSFISSEGWQVTQELDGIASELRGRLMFYGTDQEGDYETFAERCQERARRFDDMAEDILQHLGSLIQAGVLTRQEHVPDAIRELAKRHLVDRAIDIKDIDPRVFGEKAASLVRRAQVVDDPELIRALREQAITLAVLRDCPGGAENGLDALEGSVNCPKCQNDVSMSDVVQDDGTWKCPKCGHSAGDPCTTEPEDAIDLSSLEPAYA